MGSQASLDVDRIQRKNEERLRRLQNLNNPGGMQDISSLSAHAVPENFKVIFTNIRFSESKNGILSHLSLASLLWDIGKQNSPRWDAAERGVPSGANLFAWRNFIKK